MSKSRTGNLSANVERFMGFADVYDAARPQPPAEATAILSLLAGVRRAALVVDIGCGTGLSTRIWTGRARRVIGVDPSTDMLAQARTATRSRAIEFRQGFSHDTGLPAACADIVTASQCLHWMPPEPTFREVARVLRKGGVFAALDCDWPPVLPDWRTEEAYTEFMAAADRLRQSPQAEQGVQRWHKDGHLGRLQDSGRFRYCREIVLHQCEQGNAKRLVDLAMSFGKIQSLLKLGLSEREIGLDKFRRAARQTLGNRRRPWYFCYRMRIGVK